MIENCLGNQIQFSFEYVNCYEDQKHTKTFNKKDTKTKFSKY